MWQSLVCASVCACPWSRDMVSLVRSCRWSAGGRAFVVRIVYSWWREMRLFACCRPPLPAIFLLLSPYCVCVCAGVYMSSHSLVRDGPPLNVLRQPHPAQRFADRLARVVSPTGRSRYLSVDRGAAICSPLNATSKTTAIRRQQIRAVELGRDAQCCWRTIPDWRRAARSCSLFVRDQSLGVRRDVCVVSASLVRILGVSM